MTKQINITNIEWDVDDADIKLPRSQTLLMKSNDTENSIKTRSDEIIDAICEYLSDEFGYCPKFFSVNFICVNA